MRYRFKSTRFQTGRTNAAADDNEDSDNSRESADRQWQEREERMKAGGQGEFQVPTLQNFLRP
jgi:hypothetical protein